MKITNNLGKRVALNPLDIIITETTDNIYQVRTYPDGNNTYYILVCLNMDGNIPYVNDYITNKEEFEKLVFKDFNIKELYSGDSVNLILERV